VEVAEKYGMTPSELALAFVRSRWFVTSTIIGRAR
jgi:aryl-alcohol dehydrogenase (NADP+)